MSEPLSPMLALLAGGILGAIFYGGLWWTVRTSVSSAQPALWILCSLLIRTGVALTGFFFVSGGSWMQMVQCLLGFVLAQRAAIWLTRQPGDKQSRLVTEAGHAP